jgi:hypothetical protein
LLEKFYGRLRQQQKHVREMSPESHTAPGAPALDVRRQPGENTAVFVKREASDRLDKATFIDGMSDF